MNKTTIMWEEISDLGGEEEKRNIMISEDIADLDISDMIDKFIKPLLQGIGYHTSVVNEYLGGS